MTMNRKLSFAAFVLAVSTISAGATSTLAQPASEAPMAKHAGKHNPHKAALKISHELGLSPDQTAKLEPILADRSTKMQALSTDTSLTEAQRRQQRHAIAQNTRLQMGTVLSPDQMKQLKQMHRERAHEKAGAPAV
jgi:Spy/CpxP family protein refolding chaperone